MRGPLLGFLLLSSLLGCIPDKGFQGKDVNPPPGENSINFLYVGDQKTVDGEWGVNWKILMNPQYFNVRIRWKLNGPGELRNISYLPVDLSREDLGIEGVYVPPAAVPAGGAVAKLSLEVFSPATQRWESSGEFPITISHKTTPMVYECPWGLPTTVTLKGGEKFIFAVQVRPLPKQIQQRVELTQNPSNDDPLGTAHFEATTVSQWKLIYQAPPTVSVARDVTVRAIAWDPWVQQEQKIDFTVHLVP